MGDTKNRKIFQISISMVINFFDKLNILFLTIRSLGRLPSGYFLHKLVNPVETTRYHEFGYFIKSLKKNSIKPEGLILDVSSPYMMAYLLSRNARVIKTDINQSESGAIKTSPKLEFKKEDATKLSFNDNTFDIVYSISVIEHIYEKYLDAVREMVRVCKNGGYIYVTFPVSSKLSEEWMKVDIYSDQTVVDGKVFFQYQFNEEKLKEILESMVGAEIISKDIYWESKDGMYDGMTRRMRKRYKNKFLNAIKQSLLNLYYGFFLLENDPKDFSCGKQLGNAMILLKKKR